MRLRAELKLFTVLLMLVTVDSKRFCTAPSSPRNSSIFDNASSIVFNGSAVGASDTLKPDKPNLSLSICFKLIAMISPSFAPT